MQASALQTRENQESFVASFAACEGKFPGGERMAALRRAALDRFTVLGFPTTKNENWKYTNLAPFLRAAYEPAREARIEAVREKLAALPFADLGCPRLVFVNGRYAPGLSTPPEGVIACSLHEALVSGAAGAHLARYADIENNSLAALNTAFVEDGAFIEIAKGKILEQPIYALYVAAHGGRAAVTYPRTLIVAGRESQAVVAEGYLALDGGAYFTNAVTEIAVAEGAVIEHEKLQLESAQALHTGLLRVELGASSNFTSQNVAMGGALARNEISVVLEGDGASCSLYGLYAAQGTQHVDNHTTIDHAKPHTTSVELYKGILDGRSQGVFHGRIIVRPEAQKTDAVQRNKNLLLSDAASVNTKPQLEIYADDVRCTHGATVGQVDPDAVFYLRSRGIALDAARNLLTYAFTGDIIGKIRIEPIRSGLEKALFEYLAGGTHER